MRVTKKSSSRVIFFCGKSYKPVTHIYRKKKLHNVTIFLLHAFTAEKKYTTYRKKKLHNVTIFLLQAFTAKKKYTTYRKERITNFTKNAMPVGNVPTSGRPLILPPL